MAKAKLIAAVWGEPDDTIDLVARQLLAGAAEVIDGLTTEVAWIAEGNESLGNALADLPVPTRGPRAVVVPIAVTLTQDALHGLAQCAESLDGVELARPLGPEPGLVSIVLDRVRESKIDSDATLILAGKGLHDPVVRADVEAVAEDLREAWSGPVRLAAIGGGEPTVAQTVAKARAFGEEGQVAVASFQALPTATYESLSEVGADIVTAPLAPHPALVATLVNRYLSATSK